MLYFYIYDMLTAKFENMPQMTTLMKKLSNSNRFRKLYF